VKRIFDTDYSVITFATNKLSYLQLAFNCARSVLLFNEIKIYIVTNIDAPIPADLKKSVYFVSPKPEQAAMGICIKLFTIEYVQTLHTLFIDSDCLCYGDIGPIFEAAKGMHVTVAGNIVPSAQWVGEKNAADIKEHFGLDNLIRFNGGLYYIKNSDTARKIFATANKAEDILRYGYDTVRKKWINEEAQLSIGMMMYAQVPMPDDGTFMTDLFTDRRPAKLNVLQRERVLLNPAPPADLHRPWYPAKYSPVILHFGGNKLRSFPYNTQAALLYLKKSTFPNWLATALVKLFIEIPFRSYHGLVNLTKHD